MRTALVRYDRKVLAVFAATVVILLGLTFLLAYLASTYGEPDPAGMVFSAGITTVSTNVAWSALAGSVNWLGQVLFIIATVIGATNRTDLAAGATRRQILAKNYVYGGGLVLGVALVTTSVWGFAFALNPPILEGVSVATVGLIGLRFVALYLMGHAVLALFLRFRSPIVAAIFMAGIIALIVSVAVFGYPPTGLVSFEVSGSGIKTSTGLAPVSAAYITAASESVVALAIGTWATLTLPMRRS